jgi:hypothetical protein
MLFDSKHNLRPRALRETVTLIQRESATDEYGMQSLSAGSTFAVVPASVQMLSGYAKVNYYQTAEIEAYEVWLRYTAEPFNLIVWNGIELSVDSREDEGQRGRWLRVLASRRAVV